MSKILHRKKITDIPEEGYLNPLKDYFKKLPIINNQELFIDSIIQATGKKRTTVVRWINGDFQPEAKLERKLISDITGIPEETLFPKNQ